MIGGAGAVSALALTLALPLAGAESRRQTQAPAAAAGRTVTLTGFGAGLAAADPRRAALLDRVGLADPATTGGTFRFTPSASSSGRRAVTVAVRARAITRTDAVRTASANAQLAPSAYNLGVAVGWKRFALSGDIARINADLLPIGRQSAEVGVSYAGNRWNTRVEVGADRALGDTARLAGTDETYSLGLDGSYRLTRNIDLTGGVRYRMQRDRIDPTVDQRRDSQAVYIGTAFRF